MSSALLRVRYTRKCIATEMADSRCLPSCTHADPVKLQPRLLLVTYVGFDSDWRLSASLKFVFVAPSAAINYLAKIPALLAALRQPWLVTVRTCTPVPNDRLLAVRRMDVSLY